MTRNRAILAALMLGALPAICAGQDYYGSGRGRSQIDTTVSIDGRGSIDLSIISGRINVVAWNRQDVKILASVERGFVRLDASPSRVRLSLEGDRGKIGEARFDLSVPVGSRVIMNSVSGDLSVMGTKGEVDAHSVSGDIDIADASRRVTSESVSGSQKISNVDGDVRAGAVSGRLEMQNINGDIESETVSGRIIMNDARSKFVRAESVSGRLAYSGTLDPAGRYEFQSHSGSIRLAIPENSGALFHVETFSGSVESDFPAILQPNRGEGSQGRFEFKVGDGRARVTAETFSGRVYIIRGLSRDTSGD